MHELLTGFDPFDVLDDEAARINRYASSMDDAAANRPSRCDGWRVRDVLGHLAGEESYNRACLDDDLEGFLKGLAGSGITGFNGYNEWCVDQRRDLPLGDVANEFHTANDRTRQELRARGVDGSVATSVGPYPVGQQACHLASELATHADDMGAPVDPSEEPARTAWRVQIARFALAEQNAPVTVTEAADGIRVSTEDVGATLRPTEFVEATVDRLPADHPLDPRLRSVLACLA